MNNKMKALSILISITNPRTDSEPLAASITLTCDRHLDSCRSLYQGTSCQDLLSAQQVKQPIH
jgi:hypothetical protein